MILITLLTLLISVNSAMAQSEKIIGIRVDPSYLYVDFPSGLSAQQIASNLVSEIKTSGFNAIFVFAYNPIYGAFYPTNYSLSQVEQGLGKLNIFNEILKSAKLQGLKVIAGFPVNNFKKVWKNKEEWRSKKKNGMNYKPDSESFYLSAWNDEFLTWYRGLIKDFLIRNPGVDGVEALEAFVDNNWNKAADYSASHNSKFKSRYPAGVIGDSDWMQFRSEGLTQMHGILSEEAHNYNAKSYVVQTWTSNTDGTLMSSKIIGDNSGFNFDSILDLAGNKKIDYMMGEIMWQQWRSEYGKTLFDPNWTYQAAIDFVSKVKNRAIPILHVEWSEFSGANGSITPTDSEFEESFSKALSTGYSVDIYDYHQSKTGGRMKLMKDVISQYAN